eukprot:CAMPEP_0170437576 /NCGR_PEP_ID=MMETSP0117_2-20130122/44758_1 /TAXON_ID=400756 /ORGANISM="Durinskia baltica, Strain CSIRO CS-38" /LENGTH=511 /DNA_ID=CAMNT_0010697707 /DNA_START=87 /DNA_END=1618 /DNA_ORIENTATION=-
MGLNESLLTGCWEWVVGYSRESCTQTCGHVSRTCAGDHLQDVLTQATFEQMVGASYLLGSSIPPTSAALFCDGGINLWPFATAPAAFAYQTWVPSSQNSSTGQFHISHYCYYPPSVAALEGDCDTEYELPPAQRFCSCWLGDCDVPTAVPSQLPSVIPTAEPTAEPTVVPTMAETEPEPEGECLEWVLGYSRESCTLTCARMSRTCGFPFLQEIVTQQSFYDMVASATDLESSTQLGAATSFCNHGINSYAFAPVPAAFTYVLCTPSGDEEQTYCNYPTSLSALGGDCDSQYVYPPAQRFCPCTLGTCTPTPTCYEWVVGYSSESCTLTCGRMSGTCNQANLEAIVTQQAFYDMVAEATPVDAACDTGGSALVFCNQGINNYLFAESPAAFSYLTHNANGDSTETFCNYPTSLSGLNADCDTQYVYPPARRFCSCSTSCVEPSVAPTAEPTAEPTNTPTAAPSAAPTASPSASPSSVPTATPSVVPTANPSATPTSAPSIVPTANPSATPT